MAHKSWCYTINNPSPTDEAYIRTWEDRCSVHYCAKEVAPTTGTTHLQGYCCFKRSTRLSALKKLHGEAHWEPAKGGHATQYKYLFVEKEEGKGAIGTPLIQFQLPGAKNKVGLDHIAEIIREHGLKRVREEYPAEYIRSIRNLKEYERDVLRDNLYDGRPQVIWCMGPARYGKSSYFSLLYGKDNVHIHAFDTDVPGRQRWFEGYTGQHCLVLDDARPTSVSLMQLRALIDPVDRPQLECKYGGLPRSSRVIVVTSLMGPGEYYDRQEPNAQLLGRIDYVMEFTKPYWPDHPDFDSDGAHKVYRINPQTGDFSDADFTPIHPPGHPLPPPAPAPEPPAVPPALDDEEDPPEVLTPPDQYWEQ